MQLVTKFAGMYNKIIRKNIKKLRMSKHLTKEKTASLLNISTNSYNNIENGPTNLISKWLPMLAEIYDVNLLSFFEGIEEFSGYFDELNDFKISYDSKEKERLEVKHLLEIANEEKAKLKLENTLIYDNAELLKKSLQDKETIIDLLKKNMKD